jgi:Zn finger protein HypA/HybF involved in hydrogenase expression
MNGDKSYRQPPEKSVVVVSDDYRCQFCGKESPRPKWKKDKCPKCGRKYDCILAQDSEE